MLSGFHQVFIIFSRSVETINSIDKRKCSCIWCASIWKRHAGLEGIGAKNYPKLLVILSKYFSKFWFVEMNLSVRFLKNSEKIPTNYLMKIIGNYFDFNSKYLIMILH